MEKRDTEAIFDHMITGVDKWILHDNSHRKRQWLSPNNYEIHSKNNICSVTNHPILSYFRFIRTLLQYVQKAINFNRYLIKNLHNS